MFNPMFGPAVTNFPSLPPMTSLASTPPPSGDRFVAGEAIEHEQRIVTGYEEEPNVVQVSVLIKNFGEIYITIGVFP
jgi:hypothetical protein